jgi:hypothetical protein
MLGLAVFLAGCANPTGTGVSRGAADPNAPIYIKDAATLALIGTTGYPLDGQYELAASFSLPNNWTPPAPNAGAAFSGEFNGAGYTITVTGFDPKYADNYLGIFGYINGKPAPASIFNLNIELGNFSAAQNTSSYIGGLAGYIGNAALDTVTVSGSMSYSTDETVYAGGIGGYLLSVTITGTQTPPETTLSISAASVKAVAYGGGLAGYGNGVRMLKCTVTGGEVNVTGKGHHTSGGGLAGYLTNGSTVNSCSAACPVTVNAVGTGSAPADLYIAYGGGLLGYAGNKSATTLSSASGDVTVQSPYPYAGGLVGSNEGIQAGGAGSSISQCYATGDVEASALTSTVGGLPYAGGLAGYNAGNGSLIEDCYATGNVSAATGTGFSWAGGVVGANADDAVVDRTYATGEVTATAGTGALPQPQTQTSEGALAGGIAGYSYLTAATAITDSFALNGTVTAEATGTTPLDAYRVVGRNGYSGDPPPVLSGNSGYEVMELSPVHTPVSDPSGLDGADCDEFPAQGDYEAAGWEFVYTWIMDSTTGYPALR